jgi:hypothetical protein
LEVAALDALGSALPDRRETSRHRFAHRVGRVSGPRAMLEQRR